MVFGPSRLGGLDGVFPARDVQRSRAQASAPRTDAAVFSSSVPASPPPEVLSAIDNAARVLEELASKRVNLHFEYDDRSNRVRVQVLDQDGKLLREIPPTQFADIASGVEPFSMHA